MIGPLRAAHRQLFLFLGPLAVLGFLLAVMNRNEISVSELKSSVEQQLSPYTLIASQSWEGLPLILHVYGFSAAADPVALVVEVEEHFNQADPLLYFTLGGLSDGILLGAMPSTGKAFYILPELPTIYDGKLLLYALGTDTEIASSALPKAQGATYEP